MANDNELSGSEQIATMQKLNQASAAWLLGVNARSLRDQAGAPRHSDGTYDAAELYKWASGRATRPKLSDDDMERLLLIVDQIQSQPGDAFEVGIVAALTALETKHGDQIRVLLADEIVDRMRQSAAYWRDEISLDPPTAAEVRAALAKEKREHAEFVAQCIDLAMSVQCDQCGKLRRGRKWVDTKPPAGHDVKIGLCRDCSPEHGR